MPEVTPAMQQYYKIKKRHPDCIILFQLGDFYEAFYKDAKIVSDTLNIILTARNKRGKRVPMAGVPIHAIDNYLPKLINAGHKVAIVGQTEEPTKGKKLVDREVIKIVTPGTLTEETQLGTRSHRYIAAISYSTKKGAINCSVSYADTSTGEFKTTKAISEEKAKELLQTLQPSEIIVPQGFETLFFSELRTKYTVTELDQYTFDPEIAYSCLTGHFNVSTLKGFDIDRNDRLTISSAGALIQYLQNTQKTGLEHITHISIHNPDKGMIIDRTTIRNLELISPLFDQDGPSLLSTIDRTKTPMGGRLLKDWILTPLNDVKSITARNETVEFFINKLEKFQLLQELLSNVSDIERLVGKLGLNSIRPPHLILLRNSLKTTQTIIDSLESVKDPIVQKPKLLKFLIESIKTSLKEVKALIEEIDRAIVEEPSAVLHTGGIIKEGYNNELDNLREAAEKGKKWIRELEEKERKRTKINSLKVRYNKIFGYYIEISKANLSKTPANYIRKQTLVNAERFITPELKDVEARVLGAEERMIKLEDELFGQLIEKCKKGIKPIQSIAENLAILDVLLGFAEIAKEKMYVKPTVTTEDTIEIKGGRHPVVEDIAEKKGEDFVPNDTVIGGDKQQIMILTGPNMSGKSTYIRQVALITLLAQIGSFVPARLAKIGIVDRIFARVGASDNLAFGESTFMVEMLEAANILNHATSKSLVILDEVGRGTSTYDGMSIAWAIVEYIHEKIGCKTLFATHYHELTDLEHTLKRVKNYHIIAKDDGEKVFFMRKVVNGKADKSYGIHIAKLAGVPKEVVDRAWGLLEKFEKSKNKGVQLTLPLVFSKSPSKIEKDLEKIDIEKITPIEALNLLAKLKERSCSSKSAKVS